MTGPGVVSAVSPWAGVWVRARVGGDAVGPLAMGYVRVPLGVTSQSAASRVALVEGTASASASASAWGWGWVLGEMFVEDEPNRPPLAFASLMAAGRVTRPVAVVIGEVSDLGSSAAGAVALRRRIERELCVPVLVASTLAPLPVPWLLAAGAVGRRG